MYSSGLVDIKSCPSVPPDGLAQGEYAYDPMPAEVVPPIGPNHLAHLFEYPDHAEVTPVLWNRVPRKLRAQLRACPIKGVSTGWGLHFTEGMEWLVFFAYGCLGFGACLLLAVVWSAVLGDVQGGFSIAGFLLAFLVFCGGIAHSAVHE